MKFVITGNATITAENSYREITGEWRIEGCRCNDAVAHSPHLYAGKLCQGIPPKSGGIVVTKIREGADGKVTLQGEEWSGKKVSATFFWDGSTCRACGKESPHDPHAWGNEFFCEGVAGGGREPIWISKVKGCAEWPAERTWFLVEEEG